MRPSPATRRRDPLSPGCHPMPGGGGRGPFRVLARLASRLRRGGLPGWGRGWSVPPAMLDPLPWQLAPEGSGRGPRS